MNFVVIVLSRTVFASFKPILMAIRIGHQGVFIFNRSGGLEMKHVFFTRSLVLVVGLMVAGSASAALIRLNHTNFSVGPSESLTTSIDGISLTITAFMLGNNGEGSISSATQVTSPYGVYVSTSTSDESAGNIGVENSSTDSDNLDGANGDEGILFRFDRVVSLDYINFDSFGSYEDFNLSSSLSPDALIPSFDSLLVDIGGNGTDANYIESNPEYDAFNFQNVIGTQLLVWADGSSDSFRIDRIEVSEVPEAVPSPGSLPLMGLGGLLAFGFLRRRDSGVR